MYKYVIDLSDTVHIEIWGKKVTIVASKTLLSFNILRSQD